MNQFEKSISGWFIFVVLMILAIWGVILWAIIELVQWVTAK